MPTYVRPEVDLVIEEVAGGLRITQEGRTYLARKWQLTPEVRRVIDLALQYGLQCLWQQGHPGGDTSHHISFSFDRSRSSWIFVMGGEAGPPALKRVTFHRRLKEYFRHAGLGWVWDWETAGGKNILVAPTDVESILQTLPLAGIRSGTLPALVISSRRVAPQFFHNECDLEDALCDAIRVEASGFLHRQRRFGSNNDFEARKHHIFRRP